MRASNSINTPINTLAHRVNNGARWSSVMEAYLQDYIIEVTPWRTALKVSAGKLAKRMCDLFPERRVSRDAVLGKHRRYKNWRPRVTLESNERKQEREGKTT